jgi:hypothetical protein
MSSAVLTIQGDPPVSPEVSRDSPSLVIAPFCSFCSALDFDWLFNSPVPFSRFEHDGADQPELRDVELGSVSDILKRKPCPFCTFLVKMWFSWRQERRDTLPRNERLTLTRWTTLAFGPKGGVPWEKTMEIQTVEVSSSCMGLKGSRGFLAHQLLTYNPTCRSKYQG